MGYRLLRGREHGESFRQLSHHAIAPVVPATPPLWVVAMAAGGLSALPGGGAAVGYGPRAGRSDARERAEARMSELRKRFADSRNNVATQDSIRAARQLQPLGRPLTDFVGVYEEPSLGKITFTVDNGRIQYRWGAVYGTAE